MQEGLSLFDIFLLIALVFFIFSRFNSHQLPKGDKKNKRANNVFDLSEKAAKNIPETASVKQGSKNNSELSGLDQLKNSDQSFNEKEFLKGAQSAYEMYYEALSSADEQVLDDLTAPRLFDRLMEGIDAAEDKAEEKQVDVHRIENVEIVDARVHGRSAVVDVKYIAEQAEYTKNAEGKVVVGKKDVPKKVTSVWTWARALDADDLNWELEDIQLVS